LSGFHEHLYFVASAPVAQLDRASASGAEGCAFEPRRAQESAFIAARAATATALGSRISEDEEPHTVVSVEKQFKKSPPLDTDQTFTITAAAPGTYTYFCSLHPR
jgi:plastocyanin